MIEIQIVFIFFLPNPACVRSAATWPSLRLPPRPYHGARHPSAAARVTGAPRSLRTRSGSNPAEGARRAHGCVKRGCRKVTRTSLVAIRPSASSCHPAEGSTPRTGCMRITSSAKLHSSRSVSWRALARPRATRPPCLAAAPATHRGDRRAQRQRAIFRIVTL
jgi:hypothetical protein